MGSKSRKRSSMKVLWGKDVPLKKPLYIFECYDYVLGGWYRDQKLYTEKQMKKRAEFLRENGYKFKILKITSRTVVSKK